MSTTDKNNTIIYLSSKAAYTWRDEIVHFSEDIM